MKPVRLILFLLLFGIVVNGSNAKTWRVNPVTTSGAAFQSIESLLSSADFAEGDTILCDPGVYGEITINKNNVTIIGNGYNLDANTEWSEVQSASFRRINFYGLTGCTFIGLSTGFYGSCDYLTIKRCKMDPYSISGDGILIEQCYINDISPSYAYDRFTNAENLIVHNCIINGRITYENRSTHKNQVFFNNTIIQNSDNLGHTFKNAKVYNNIFICAKCKNALGECINCSIYNNVFSNLAENADERFPDNHYVGATIENTFVNVGREDGKYRLNNESPAIGCAADGGDCGAFGGPMPYVLSGIPNGLPQITKAIVPTSPTNGKINVTITIATGNE